MQHIIQVRQRPRRACAQQSQTYCEFLFSGDEGSDSSEGNSNSDSDDDEDERYDATHELQFPRKNNNLICVVTTIFHFKNHGLGGPVTVGLET